MNNTRNPNYLQPYVSVSQSQPLTQIEMYSTAYSPSSPYGSSPYSGYNLLAEHEVKIEGMPHTSPHAVHSHHHHHQQLSHMTSQQHSRSPSVDDEQDLQSQIMTRNSERPTVVNIKMEEKTHTAHF